MKNTRELYRQTAFKYKLMRVRSKISYAAFKNRMVVSEFIMHMMMTSYNELTRSGSIPPIGDYPPELIERFEDMLDDFKTDTISDLRELAQYK